MKKSSQKETVSGAGKSFWINPKSLKSRDQIRNINCLQGKLKVLCENYKPGTVWQYNGSGFGCNSPAVEKVNLLIS